MVKEKEISNIIIWIPYNYHPDIQYVGMVAITDNPLFSAVIYKIGLSSADTYPWYFYC